MRNEPGESDEGVRRKEAGAREPSATREERRERSEAGTLRAEPRSERSLAPLVHRSYHSFTSVVPPPAHFVHLTVHETRGRMT